MATETNKKAVDEILSMIDEDPVIFIGSGLSLPYFKNWFGLIEELSDTLKLPLHNKEDPIQAAQMFYENNPDAYQEALVSIFGSYPPDCRDALRDVVSIKFKSFITTNYDWSIEQAFFLTNQDIPMIYAYPGILSSLCVQQSIHHIHGVVKNTSFEISNFILHKQAYMNAYYYDGKILSRYLFDVFFNNNILFVGYSMSKSEPINGVIDCVSTTLEEIQTTNKELLPPRIRKILLPNDIHSENDDRFRRLNIQIIRYDSYNESFSGLDEVWRSVFLSVKDHQAVKVVEPFNPLKNLDNP